MTAPPQPEHLTSRPAKLPGALNFLRHAGHAKDTIGPMADGMTDNLKPFDEEEGAAVELEAFAGPAEQPSRLATKELPHSSMPPWRGTWQVAPNRMVEQCLRNHLW